MRDYPRNMFKAARVLLDLNVDEFAKFAKISTATLSIIESTNKHVHTRSIEKVGSALETLGIDFTLPSAGFGSGIRLREEKHDPKNVI